MSELNIALFDTGFEAKKDEAALCQLGAAVALKWSEIPSSLQNELLSLAEKVFGGPYTPIAASHIQGLIERNANRT